MPRPFGWLYRSRTDERSALAPGQASFRITTIFSIETISGWQFWLITLGLLLWIAQGAERFDFGLRTMG
jgi:hypothetical protein